MRASSVTTSISASSPPLDERNPNDARILGDDDFAAKLLGEAWRPRSRKTLANLTAEACQRFSVNEDALHSPIVTACQQFGAGTRGKGTAGTGPAVA